MLHHFPWVLSVLGITIKGPVLYTVKGKRSSYEGLVGSIPTIGHSGCLLNLLNRVTGDQMKKFSVGQKVRYAHGKGMSTGSIAEIKGDVAVLETKGGFHINRPMTRIKSIKV